MAELKKKLKQNNIQQYIREKEDQGKMVGVIDW